MFLYMIRVNNGPDKHIQLQLNQNEQSASKPQMPYNIDVVCNGINKWLVLIEL